MKAVLVFNMPSSCKDCRTTCTGYTGKEYEEYCQIGYGRPEWCPLRPLPREISDEELKENIKKIKYDDDKHEYYGEVIGWNTYREKLIGEFYGKD